MQDKLRCGIECCFGSYAKKPVLHGKCLAFGLAFFLSQGCAIFQGKEQYSWAELDDAADLECVEWPGVEDMPSIADAVIQDLRGPGRVGSVVGTGLDRKGRHALAVSRFQPAEKLSQDDVAVLSFKGKPPQIIQGNCTLGATQTFTRDTPDEIRDSSLFLVSTGDPGVLQLRRAADNQVLASAAALPAGIRAELAVSVASGCLLVARDEEDNPKLLHLEDGGQLAPIDLASIKTPFPRGRWLKAGKQEDGSVLVATVPADGVKGAQELPWALIKGTRVSQSGVTAFKSTLPVDGADVLAVEGGFYVAAIGGDSLVGEAKLHMNFYSINQGVGSPVWSQVVTLENVHLAPPRLVRRGPASAAALLPKWVDRESTVGSYRLSPKGFSQSGNRGVFPEPATILDTAETTEGALAMVKFRRGQGWRQNLCEIKW